jgi:hypothetical protein
MDNNFVTAEELNEYSLILKKEMDSLKNEIKSASKGSGTSSISLYNVAPFSSNKL